MTAEEKQERRERLGVEDPERATERGLAAFARRTEFLRDQNNRPLAKDNYLQEVAEMDDAEDGRFLTQVLDRLADEVRVLLVRGSTRELALALTHIEDAKHWATEHGVKTNSHVIIDRRIFRIESGGSQNDQL